MSGSSATFLGNLGQDFEVRHTDSGTSLAKSSLAVTTGWGDSKHTTWWRLTVWGKKGETMAEHFGKGDKVFVTGEVSVRTYEKKDGTEGWSAEMTVSDFAFVASTKDSPPRRAQAGDDNPFA